MKTSRIFLVAIAAALALVSAGAQAMGIDVHALLAPHADAMAGLGMVAAVVDAGFSKVEFHKVVRRCRAGDVSPARRFFHHPKS